MRGWQGIADASVKYLGLVDEACSQSCYGQKISAPGRVDSTIPSRLSAADLCRLNGEGDVGTTARQCEARASPVAGPKEHTSALEEVS